MLRTVVREGVIVMDSISSIARSDRGCVVVSASNGGAASGVVAAEHGCALVVCNDAGFGKDDAGVAGLRARDGERIPAVAVHHRSAEISNGMDTWENGVVSYVNETAREHGIAVGEPVKEAVMRFLESR